MHTRFEYTEHQSTLYLDAKELNVFGAMGWELVTVIPCADYVRYVFKRSIPGSSSAGFAS